VRQAARGIGAWLKGRDRYLSVVVKSTVALRTLDLGTKTVFDARRMFAPGELACGRYLAIGRRR
jgi:hypothetical protein